MGCYEEVTHCLHRGWINNNAGVWVWRSERDKPTLIYITSNLTNRCHQSKFLLNFTLNAVTWITHPSDFCPSFPHTVTLSPYKWVVQHTVKRSLNQKERQPSKKFQHRQKTRLPEVSFRLHPLHHLRNFYEPLKHKEWTNCREKYRPRLLVGKWANGEMRLDSGVQGYYWTWG